MGAVYHTTIYYIHKMLYASSLKYHMYGLLQVSLLYVSKIGMTKKMKKL